MRSFTHAVAVAVSFILGHSDLVGQTPPPSRFPLTGNDVTNFSSTQYVESHVVINEKGAMQGEVVLWNEDLAGYCAQAVFLIVGRHGDQLTYFTGGGCVRGGTRTRAGEEHQPGAYPRGGMDKIVHKKFELHADFDPTSLAEASEIRIKVIPDDKAEVTPEMVATLFTH